MNRSISSLIRYCSIPVALLVSNAAALAQNGGTEVTFRILCFEHRNDITSVLAPGNDAQRIEVPLYTNEFSDQMKARFIGGKASFYIEETGADGKPARKVVAEGKLAAGNRQAFVLIPTDGEKGPTYRVVAFDDREESFPMGATRVINLAPFPIRLNLAGADMEPIKPGGLGLFPMVRKVDEWNMYSARIDFEVQPEQWVAVATQSWKSSDGKRDWVVTRFDQATRQPAIRLYQDIPPWRKKVLPVGGG